MQGSGITIKVRQPDEMSEQSPDAGIEACMKDLISAIHANDIPAAVKAFKSAIECSESEPEAEDHIEPHSYESQKND